MYNECEKCGQVCAANQRFCLKCRGGESAKSLIRLAAKFKFDKETVDSIDTSTPDRKRFFDGVSVGVSNCFESVMYELMKLGHSHDSAMEMIDAEYEKYNK